MHVSLLQAVSGAGAFVLFSTFIQVELLYIRLASHHRWNDHDICEARNALELDRVMFALWWTRPKRTCWCSGK